MPDSDIVLDRILRRADRCLSKSVREASPEMLDRARFLIVVIMSAVVVSLGFTVFHIASGRFIQAGFVSAAIILILTTLAILRRPERLGLATHFLLTIILSMIVISPMLAHEVERIYIGAIIVPFIAVVAGGVQTGLFWTPIVAFMLAATTLGFDSTAGERFVAWHSIVVVVALGYGISFFEVSRQRAKQKANRFSEQAERHAAQRL